MKILLVNNDSDTWSKLVTVAEATGHDVDPIHHSAIGAIDARAYDVAILSGGWWADYQEIPEVLDMYAEELQFIKANPIPILGICVGMQLLHVALNQAVPLMDEPQSGDADAVVNLLNLVNTVIAANESFVGTINVYGNLYGDILLSPEFIPHLLASNADNVIETDFNMPLSTNINDDQTIVNNIDLSATSGTASVKDNTSAGSATSGNAQTKLQILNLTGREVDAESGLLVFVNVKGTWVGLLLDAPGATAAAYGSGVTKDSTTLASTVNVNNRTAITNNINVSAVSGDANVESNTSGGDAKTGDAYASANVANISNSKLNFKKNLMILYINIFGDWKGYALTNSPAGDVIETVSEVAASSPPPPSVGSPNVRLGFVPRVAQAVGQATSAVAASTDDSYPAAVLASAVTNGGGSVLGETLKPGVSPREDPFSTILMIGGFGVAGISAIIWAARRLLEMRGSQIV